MRPVLPLIFSRLAGLLLLLSMMVSASRLEAQGSPRIQAQHSHAQQNSHAQQSEAHPRGQQQAIREPEAPHPEQAGTALIEGAIDRFERRVKVLRQEFNAQPSKPLSPDWVRRKLAHMVEVDQYLREFASFPFEQGFSREQQDQFLERLRGLWFEIEADHTHDLKVLLDIHGWITISEFGSEADHDAWLLVQHADRDRDFQHEVLEQLEQLSKKGETSPKNFAYLYDRLAVAEERPQRYGTQGRCTGPGKWTPRALEDPGRIDELRAAVGLEPMADYLQQFEDACDF